MPFPRFETQSLPSLLRCCPRSFTFYLGNPFPRFRFDFVADLFRLRSHFLRSVRFHDRSSVNLIDSAQNSVENRAELVESPHSCGQVASVAISRIGAILSDV
jgi:hypothetical protein